MKTQKARLEEAEQKKSPEKHYVIKQVLDCKSLSGEDLFKYGDEEKLMTLEEAQERFEEGALLYITYAKDWKPHINKNESLSLKD